MKKALKVIGIIFLILVTIFLILTLLTIMYMFYYSKSLAQEYEDLPNEKIFSEEMDLLYAA